MYLKFLIFYVMLTSLWACEQSTPCCDRRISPLIPLGSENLQSSNLPHLLLPLLMKCSTGSSLGWGVSASSSLMNVLSLYVYVMIHRDLKTRKYCYYLYSSCLCSVTLYYSICPFKPVQRVHITYWRHHLTNLSVAIHNTAGSVVK